MVEVLPFVSEPGNIKHAFIQIVWHEVKLARLPSMVHTIVKIVPPPQEPEEGE